MAQYSCFGRGKLTEVRWVMHASLLLACPGYYMVLSNAIQRLTPISHYCHSECLNWASVYIVPFPQILLLFLMLLPSSFCCWGWLWVNRTPRRLDIERSMINLFIDIILYRWMGIVDRATALQLFYSGVPKPNTNMYEKWRKQCFWSWLGLFCLVARLFYGTT